MRDRKGVRRSEAGLGLVEIAIVLVVLAIVGSVLYQYFSSSTKTVEKLITERPLSQARLTADRATVTAIRGSLQIYHAQNGQYPPSKQALAALLNPPPNFQCAGNDIDYDPASGAVRLLIDDASRC